MPLLSWFSSSRSTTTSTNHENNSNAAPGQAGTIAQTCLEATDFETLAENVHDLRAKCDQAMDLCEQANLQFEKYRVEALGLKHALKAEREAHANTQRLLDKTKDTNRQLEDLNRKLQTNVKRETVLNAQANARLNTEMASLRAMTKHARLQEERLIDTQLDLEYLKCTTDLVPSSYDMKLALDQDAPLPAQPFVVVLVDGDAYKWALDINVDDMFLGTSPSNSNSNSTTSLDFSGPGAVAAMRIRNEVTKYILQHSDSIPVTAKIVTRVFSNFSGRSTLRTSLRQNKVTTVGLAEFAVQFTEKQPLFDFFDAGRGKERADDKIRENFHLYLSTPNCHAVFVAACLDNGFARMLEPYSSHLPSRRKIVLVSHGYMGLEIQHLGLPEVTWSAVFAHRNVPAHMIAKGQKEARVRASATARRLTLGGRSISTPSATTFKYTALGGDEAGKEDVVWARLLDLVPSWNVNAAMGKASRGVGLRVSRTQEGLEHLDLVDVIERSEDVD